MLETSVLDELTADACAAVTGRQDAAALLRSIEAANLFIVALDDDRTSYRYHHLVREVLRAQLRAMDRGAGAHAAAPGGRVAGVRGRHAGSDPPFPRGRAGRPGAGLAAGAGGGRLLHDPAAPAALDLSMVDPSLLTGVPERLLALAADLLLWGDWVRGGEYLDLLERSQPAIPPDSRLASRLAVMRSLRCALTGEADRGGALWPRGAGHRRADPARG